MIIYSSLARVSQVHSNLALTFRSVQCSQIRANPFWLTLRERSLLSRHSKADFNLLSRHRGTGIQFCLKSSFKFRTTGPLFFLAATTFRCFFHSNRFSAFTFVLERELSMVYTSLSGDDAMDYGVSCCASEQKAFTSIPAWSKRFPLEKKVAGWKHLLNLALPKYYCSIKIECYPCHI